MTGAIHIHEDDWGMRTLHPLSAAKEVQSDIDAAIAAGERNRAPDGAGWTDVHVIAQPSVDYTSAGLSVQQASEALALILPRVRNFAATASSAMGGGQRDPYGSYETDAHCYGTNAGCFIKLETEGALVRQIWFECDTDADDRARLRRGLEAIDRLCASVIADYWLDRTGAVSDAAFMDDYMRALADEP